MITVVWLAQAARRASGPNLKPFFFGMSPFGRTVEQLIYRILPYKGRLFPILANMPGQCRHSAGLPIRRNGPGSLTPGPPDRPSGMSGTAWVA